MPRRFAVSLIAMCCSLALNAEEGFWPFDMVPIEAIARRYSFTPSDAWLEKARKAALRVSTGGSGSFVSPHGLAMTNRHVAGSVLQRLSVPGKTDLIRDGFLARTSAEELKAPNLRLEQLIEIVNINDAVRAAMERFHIDDERAMQTVQFQAERDDRREHLRIQALKMYPDGEFRLYKFKVYDDVRLVFAADISSGYFGGDTDNFTYPRYDFDVAFVRAYENGKPAETPDYFPWSRDGVQENELVFFAGNPGETERSITRAHLELTRDKKLPIEIALYAREAALLHRYGELGPAQFQLAQDRLNHTENSLKRLRGQLDGLRDPSIFDRKQAEEDAAGKAITDPQKAKLYSDALAEMRRAVERIQNDETEYQMLRSFWGVLSAQLATALSIAGMEENGRYFFSAAEQRELRYESLYLYDPLKREDSERKQLAESFEFMLTQLGGKHPLVALILDGKSPADRAAELSSGSRLGRADFYKSASNGGFPGIDKSGDAMLILGKKILQRTREVNLRQQREFGDVAKKCYAQIARALGQTPSVRRAPDGNFSPRLSFGTVRGYEDHGRAIQPFTCFERMYDLNRGVDNREPYHLTETWLLGRAKFDLCTPYNFVTDADGYGGNSGSPVFNRNRELVGILFDGNYPGLVGKFLYDERTKRSVCVDSRAIVEVLSRVYGAMELVKEFAPFTNP